VHDITLANTKIKGFDGQMFSVPNNQVWGDTIENLTHDKIRRITIMLRVSFEEDLNRVQQLMLDIMNTNPQVEKKPAASTSLWRIEEYYISMYCSAWVKTEIFWHVYEQLMYETKERFDQEGVQLAAIPRTDINLYQRSKLENGKTMAIASEVADRTT
jgi:small conductance mechanosensitive channel